MHAATGLLTRGWALAQREPGKAVLGKVQQRFRHTSFLFVDEKSMVGLQIAGAFDARVEQGLVGRRSFYPLVGPRDAWFIWYQIQCSMVWLLFSRQFGK